jgi:hypothetical protein
VKILKDVPLLTLKYLGKQERKELLSLFKRSLCIQGKNPALGIFPKAAINTKIALINSLTLLFVILTISYLQSCLF